MIFDFVARAKRRRCTGEITLTLSGSCLLCLIFCPGSYCFQKISACGGRGLIFVLILTLCLPLKAQKFSACGGLIFGGVLFF